MVTPFLAAAGEAQRNVALDLFIILALAGFVAIVMQRMRLAVVPAYLIAGALIGPNVPWGILTSQESLEQVAQLAIILLLFGIGLELDITVLRRGLGRMVLAGVGSCVLTVVLGFPLALLFRLDVPAALAVAMAFSLSSTAVVLRMITARRELRRRSGRLAFAILVIQDVIVLAMLALLPLLARSPGAADASLSPADRWLGFLREAVLMIGGVTALVIAAKALLPLMLRESLRGRRLEVMMLVGIAAALAAALVAQAIGFSLEMGAFLAGFVLSGTPFRHQLSGQIGPLRDIFSALFFTTVGMKLDPAVVAGSWWAVLLAVVALAALKALVIGGMCWSVGASASNALIVGLFLAQAGEFSLILVGEAHDLGIFGHVVAANAIAIVVISLIVTPSLAELGRRLGRSATRLGHAPWVRSSLFGDAPEAADGGPEREPGLKHVVVAGLGPVGQRIVEALEHAGVGYTVIELNPDTVADQLRRKRPIVFGDVANLHVLESAGIGHADALVLTVPDEDAVLRACAVARRRAPDLFIAVRTALASRQEPMRDMGADQVVVDEAVTADALAAVVRQRLELDAPAAAAEAEEDVAEALAAEERAEAEAEQERAEAEGGAGPPREDDAPPREPGESPGSGRVQSPP